jgi:3-hydroxyisobutyrate dehydrogenase
MAERVALLGTGIMGTPMARSLLKAGFRVRVWNRTPEKARVLAAEGAHLAETPADAVREAAFVNCPVIGTRETAKRGRLVVLASGPGDALDRAQPIFDAIASKTVRLEPETGRVSRLKLVATAWTVGLVESLRVQLSRGR